jgi:hypothetical protein
MADSTIPGFATNQDIASNPNCSILNDYHYTSANHPLVNIIDNHNALDLRQKYDDMNRDYEMRQAYGLNTVADSVGHNSQVSDLGRDAMQRTAAYQGQQAQASVASNPNMQPLVVPATVVGGAAALYRGSGVNVINSGNIKLRAKASVRNQTTGLELISPIVHGSVDMTMTAPTTADTYAPLDPMARIERYRLSLTRNLPFDVSSGVYYGTTTSTMSASLSRKITDHLTAVVDTAKTMDPSLEVISPSEQSLRLLYGLRF